MPFILKVTTTSQSMAASMNNRINPSLHISDAAVEPPAESLPEYKESSAIVELSAANTDPILPVSQIPTVRFQRLDYNNNEQVQSLCEMWSDAFQDKREHWCTSREDDIKNCLRAIDEYKANYLDKLNGFCVAVERDEQRGTEEVIGGISVNLYGQMGDIRMPEWARHKCKSGEAYIDWIGVHADARGKGIGKGLLEFSENYARANGCTILALEVVKGNRAKGLYERKGFEVVTNPDDEGCPDCCLNCIAWCMVGYCGIYLMHKPLDVVV